MRIGIGLMLGVELGLSAAFFRSPAAPGLRPLLLVAVMAALGMAGVWLSDRWLGPQEEKGVEEGWNRTGTGGYDPTRDAIISTCRHAVGRETSR